MANESIDIGSFYWTLRAADFYNHSSAWQGESVFNNILKAGTKRGINIRIAQNAPTKSQPNLDTEILIKQKAAKVRSVNFARLFGAGVLHTKLWIVDGKHMYVGSANMDWRSLTQVTSIIHEFSTYSLLTPFLSSYSSKFKVKELGVIVTNCSCLVKDISKIFNVYWDMGKPNAVIPPNWPDSYRTRINASNPMPIEFNHDFKMNTFLSVR